jgi:NTP pyrophosphatase (non-canonical NTP hydrolase)
VPVEYSIMSEAWSLTRLQRLIGSLYETKDRQRGSEGNFMWLMEEVGELAAALRAGTPQQQAEEFADVLAWLVTLANVAGVDLEAAIRAKYGEGCPGCGQTPCACAPAAKP